MTKFIIAPHMRLQEWVAEDKGYFPTKDSTTSFAMRSSPKKARNMISATSWGLPDVREGPHDRHRLRVPLDGQCSRVDPGARKNVRRRLLGLASGHLRAAGIKNPHAGPTRRRKHFGRIPVRQPLLGNPGARAIYGCERYSPLVLGRNAFPPHGTIDRAQGSGGLALQRPLLFPRAARLPQSHRHHVHDGHDDHGQSRKCPTWKTSGNTSARCGARSGISTCVPTSTRNITRRSFRNGSTAKWTRDAGDRASALSSSHTLARYSKNPSAGFLDMPSFLKDKWVRASIKTQ